MQKNLLITDLDGTIVESQLLAWEYLNRIAKKKGEELRDYHNYRSSLQFYWNVITVFGLKSLKLIPRMRRYMYLNDSKILAYPGAVDGLENLYKNGWKIIVVTDNDDEYAKKVLIRNGLDTEDWIEVRSAETETKIGIITKILKEYRGSSIYFASHDKKDFWYLNIATWLSLKTAKKIFTPNEIDKKSSVHPQLTIAQFAHSILAIKKKK